MELTQDYSRRHIISDNSEPGPILELTVTNFTDANLTTSDYFLIDTGADITLIREQIFTALELEISGEVFISGVSDKQGGKNEAVTCYILLEIPDIEFKKRIEVVINEQNEDNILGRDILKYLELCLDGPKQKFILKKE